MNGFDRGLQRRRLLWAAAGLTAYGLAGCGQPAKPPPTPTPSPTPSPKPTPSPSARKVAVMPIHTLAEFASRAGPATFPAGAIALTLDDGPHAIWTPKILRLLAKLDVKATFFMIGVQAKGHPDLVRAIADGGHVVGNHTYNHLLLPKLSVPNIRQQIVATQDAVHNACGTYPKVFRAPGGAWSPAVLTEVAAAETVPLHWQVDTNDWSRPGTGAIERRLRGAGSGAVILCHDGGGDRSQTYAALGRAIPALKARGHQFVTLDDRH